MTRRAWPPHARDALAFVGEHVGVALRRPLPRTGREFWESNGDAARALGRVSRWFGRAG